MASLNDGERHMMIKAVLRTKGISFTQLALQNEVSVSMISLVSKGQSKSARVEHVLAEAVGMTRQQLWPDRPMEAAMR